MSGEPVTKAQEISELVRRLCVALSNVEAFSVEHALAKRNIAAAYECLNGLLQRQKKTVVVSASGKKMLFNAIPLEDRNPLVEKFAMRLEETHANHLSFEPDLTETEFIEFFRVLGKGARVINEQGGVAAMLTAAQVTHVKARRIDFVMIAEDERVVSKDAQVIESTPAANKSKDANIVQYVLEKLLARADDQQWLVQEMKNNPQRVADMFMEGINLAASRAEMGMTTESSGLDALMKNIQYLTSALVTEEQAAAPAEDQEKLEKSIVMLENEIRQRANHLTSSKVAAGVLSEILGVIASYTDRARARRIANEFVKGERSLEKAEQLLRNLTPAQESVENFVGRIRDHLVQRGVSEADLTQLEKTIKKQSRPKRTGSPKPRAKRRKRFSQVVATGITKRLQELHLEGAQLEKTVESLSTFIEDRARERAGEMRFDLERLQGEVARRDQVLENLSVGVVLWNAEGKVELCNHAAIETLNGAGHVDLSDGLRRHLCDGHFPMTEPAALTETGLAPAEMELLRSVSLVLKSESGEIYGVLLSASR